MEPAGGGEVAQRQSNGILLEVGGAGGGYMDKQELISRRTARCS